MARQTGIRGKKQRLSFRADAHSNASILKREYQKLYNKKGKRATMPVKDHAQTGHILQPQEEALRLVALSGGKDCKSRNVN